MSSRAGAATLDDRAVRLFIALAAFFCVNAVLAEFIGVKIFALEDTLGIAPLEWNLFGQTGSLSFTAGTLLWPVVFLMTDVVNEFYGRRGVRMISWLAAVLIVYGFVFAFVAIALAPAGWWVKAAQAQGVADYQAAFAAVFGQGPVDDRRLAGRLHARPVDRRRRVPPHPPRHRREARVAARDRLDRGVATGRQLRGAVHRVRARPAAVADLAVPGRQHGQLRLQDARGDRADPADLPGARRHHRATWAPAAPPQLRDEAAAA